MALRAAALVFAMLLAAGCGGSGGSGDGGATTAAAARPEPVDAKKTVDAFLYSPPVPARVCPKLWVEAPKSQSQCAALLRRLKVAKARRVFALPKRGTMQYRLGGVSGKIVTIEAGDRQPAPTKGPPTFYGVFDLERAGSGWKIVRFDI
jgi:hypothetical protein